MTKKHLLVSVSLFGISSVLWAAAALSDGPQQQATTPAPAVNQSATTTTPPPPVPETDQSLVSKAEKDLGGVDQVDASTVTKEDITDPNLLPVDKQLYCINHILNVVNKKFKANFARNEIHGFEFMKSNNEYLGFVRGGAFNIHVISDHVSPEIAQSIHPGRYTDLKNILQLGIGASLHVEDDFDGFNHTFVRSLNDDGTYKMEFFAHIDSAFAYFVPTGTLAHFLIDVLGSRTRHPCPGTDEEAKVAAAAELAADDLPNSSSQ